MIPNRKTTLIMLSVAFFAIYGIGMQPYFDLYLLIFTPEAGFFPFKLMVVYKFLLAFAIFVTSFGVLKSKKVTLSFLVLNVIYSLSVVFMNALVIFGYNELNTFFYNDGFLIVRIVQQIIWIGIITVIFLKNSRMNTYLAR